MCPRSVIYRLRTWCKSSLWLRTLFNTSSFVTLSAHENILRNSHTSAAAILFVISLFTVQLSHPFRMTDHTYVFKILILIFNKIFLSFVNGFNLLSASFANAILFFTSGKHFPWALMLYPRHLKVLTCLMFCSWLSRKHTGPSAFLDVTKHKLLHSNRKSKTHLQLSSSYLRTLKYMITFHITLRISRKEVQRTLCSPYITGKDTGSSFSK